MSINWWLRRARFSIVGVILILAGACTATPTGAEQSSAQSTSVSSAATPSAAASSNGQAVCADVRTMTNHLSKDYSDAYPDGKPMVLESWAKYLATQAARANDPTLHSALEQLANLVSSWVDAPGTVDFQRYVDILNSACRPWFG